MASRKTFIKEIQEEKEKALSAFIDMKGSEASEDNSQEGSGNSPRMKERRTERLNLLVGPSAKADLHKIAHMKRTSANNLINHMIDKYIEDNQAVIEKYDAIFGEDEEV
ncbi:MAG: hypothetical protein IKQ25_09365 [Lachnospiraceae bacterium]|nr:hypothetical protein [Lachnospiraceae bacterium]